MKKRKRCGTEKNKKGMKEIKKRGKNMEKSNAKR